MNNIVYSWNFNPLEIIYNEETLTNVVTVVHWQYTATVDDIPEIRVGTVSLDAPSVGAFIPFESLTKEMLVNWVEAKLGEEYMVTMKTSLDTILNQKLFPVGGIISPSWT